MSPIGVANDAMVAKWAKGRHLGLCGHALTETCSVLTRLPGDARVHPADAVVLIDENFAEMWRRAGKWFRLDDVRRRRARFRPSPAAVGQRHQQRLVMNAGQRCLRRRAVG